MSLILDALNKSEQDRPEHGATPGLHTVHQGTSQEDRRWVWVIWPVATVIFASLALGLWLGRAADTPVPVSVQQTEPVKPAAETLAETTLPEVLPEPAIVATDIPVEAAPAQDSGVAALYAPVIEQLPRVEDAPVVDDTPVPIDIDALTQAAEQALAERPASDHAVPLISELNQSTKDEIPSLFFTAHRWGISPQDKDVVINGKTYREGDLVKPGLRLTEILEDSIVLDYRGTQFRLSSLNSWVNL